jgi:sugar lactone lactonase YvrE
LIVIPCRQSFDAQGNLYVVDIPFGRIFRIAPSGEWSLAIAYEGWPNGLKIAADGPILVADYKHGFTEFDAKAGRMQPLLTARNSESFCGCNDLHPASLGHVFVFAPNGELIARIRSYGGRACTNVTIGGKSRDRLYITESATGTGLVADVSALDQCEM